MLVTSLIGNMYFLPWFKQPLKILNRDTKVTLFLILPLPEVCDFNLHTVLRKKKAVVMAVAMSSSLF